MNAFFCFDSDYHVMQCFRGCSEVIEKTFEIVVQSETSLPNQTLRLAFQHIEYTGK